MKWCQIAFERIWRHLASCETWMRWNWWNWTLRSSTTVFLLSTKLLFNPFGCFGCSKFFSFNQSFDLAVFVSLSIMMNFVCLLKTWFFFWKCLYVNMASGFLKYLLWLFRVILKPVSDFPAYCFLHKVHSIS